MSSLGWLGVGFAQLTLGVTALGRDDLLERHHAYEITGVLGQVLSAPLAVIALVTGVVLSTRTRWGLAQRWWVVVKLALTVAMIIFGATLVGGWFEQATTETAATAAAQDAGHAAARAALLGGAANVATMVFLVAVSVIKPWGRTPRGRRLADA